MTPHTSWSTNENQFVAIRNNKNEDNKTAMFREIRLWQTCCALRQGIHQQTAICSQKEIFCKLWTFHWAIEVVSGNKYNYPNKQNKSSDNYFGVPVNYFPADNNQGAPSGNYLPEWSRRWIPANKHWPPSDNYW